MCIEFFFECKMWIENECDHVLKNVNTAFKKCQSSIWKVLNMYMKNVDHVLKNGNLVFKKC